LRRRKSSEGKYVLIFNATTIIVLRELQRGELIDEIRKHGIAKVLIPQGVMNEFRRAGVQIDTPSNNIPAEHISKDEPMDVPPSLGEGERQVIAVAHALTKSQSAGTVIVVTDDRKARKVCNKMGLNVIGTLGLIEFAKKHGVITKEEALNLLEKIPRTSLYLSPELLRKAQTKLRQQ